MLLLAALPFLLIAQFNSNKEPLIVKSLANETIKNVQVKTSGGSIAVSGVSAGDARIEVYVSPNNNRNNLTKEEIQQRLDDRYDLQISVDNGKLVAIAKSKSRNNWREALNISFKVFVTKNVSTDLLTSGGSINLNDLSGDLDFSTSGGSLNLDNVSGKVDGKTSGGSINVKNSKDDIYLSTSGGSINAKNCDGKLRLNTSGGSLNLEDLKGEIKAATSGGSVKGNNIDGELKAHTSGGSIHFTNLSGSVETGTSGGRIYVEIKEMGEYVKIKNSSGNIDVVLPKNSGLDINLSGNVAKTKFDHFDGRISEHRVDGKLNGGGIPVQVSTSSGTISLSLE